MTSIQYNCYHCEKNVTCAIARIFAENGIKINLACPNCGKITQYDTTQQIRKGVELF